MAHEAAEDLYEQSQFKAGHVVTLGGESLRINVRFVLNPVDTKLLSVLWHQFKHKHCQRDVT